VEARTAIASTNQQATKDQILQNSEDIGKCCCCG
jgi:hypothetical protein